MLIHSVDKNEVIDYLDGLVLDSQYSPIEGKIALLVPFKEDKPFYEFRYKSPLLSLTVFAANTPEDFERINGYRPSTIIILNYHLMDQEVLENVWRGWAIVSSSEPRKLP